METERLVIDQINETDKEDYFISISHDKRVLETFICRYADTLEEFDFFSYPGRQNLFAIRLKKTRRLIGIILYFDEKEDSCEIGYGIGSGLWNQGYATEAVERFLEYLFWEKGMQTVYASFFTGNVASLRVMEKCGMIYDHFSEKELVYLGIERDLTYYAIHRKLDVILLNGPSSAGKSSIAKALRQKLHESGNTVIISLDDYLQMSADEPIWEDDVFAIMPRMCEDIAAALQNGKMVIIDHVITSVRIYHALKDAVAGYQMKTVLVSCDVETLRRRETERGDRCAGSAESSLQYLYPKTGYDLCIDSSEASPAVLAEVIFSALLRCYRERRNMNMKKYITLRDEPELKNAAAAWFHSKWGVPEQAYLDCMTAYLNRETEYGWYLCLDGDRIIGGMGVIENDFHDRKDLMPNVCAVWIEEVYRNQGIAGRLLSMVVEDMRSKGISPLYLVTDHTGFYERYGWEFFCMVQGNDEPGMTRMYIHR